MSKTWNKWRVWCVTDSKYEYVILEDDQADPTTCPVNGAHAVGDIHKSEVKTESVISIREEPEGEPRTGGHFAEISLALTTQTPNTVADYEFSSPIPFAMLSAHLLCKDVTDGDRIGFDVDPNSVVGVLGAAVAIGVKTIPVPQSVIDLFSGDVPLMWVGQILHLSDGVTTDDLGLIQSYDAAAKTITASIDTVTAFSIGDPIQVTTSMTPPLMDTTKAQGWLDLDSGDSEVAFGVSKIGASHIPANTTIRIRYDDKGAGGAKIKARLEALI